jgi:hypothetical protein
VKTLEAIELLDLKPMQTASQCLPVAVSLAAEAAGSQVRFPLDTSKSDRREIKSSSR